MPHVNPTTDAVDDADYIEQVKKLYADQINPKLCRNIDSTEEEDPDNLGHKGAGERKSRAKAKTAEEEQPLPEDEEDRITVLPGITYRMFRDAMYAGQGFKNLIAEALHIRIFHVTKVLEKYRKLMVEFEEFEEARIDEAEFQLMGQIRLGNMKAIQFFLGTKGKDRGYTDKLDKTEAEPPKLRIVPAAQYLEKKALRDEKERQAISSGS